jgi:hypothetical protein
VNPGPRPAPGPSPMTPRKLALATTAVALLSLAAPAQALAASDLNQVISNLRVWLTGLLALLATVALIIGGIRYLFSGHDPGQIERAKGSFKAAVAGYALALLAPVLVSIVQRIVG